MSVAKATTRLRLAALLVTSVLVRAAVAASDKATDCFDPNDLINTGGPEYDVHCNSSPVGWEVLSRNSDQSKYTLPIDCIGNCSTYRGGLCHGVVLDIINSVCWTVYSNFSFSGNEFAVQRNESAHFVAAWPWDLQPVDYSCSDGDIYNYPGDDLAFVGKCDHDVYAGDAGHPVHADSLYDCMAECGHVENCTFAVFNPDLSLGFQNCIFKHPNEQMEVFPRPESDNKSVVHIGTNLVGGCDSDGTVTISDKISYSLSCQEEDRGGNVIGLYLAASVEECAHVCEGYNPEHEKEVVCVAFVYDYLHQNGWDNCKVLNSTGSNDRVWGFVTGTRVEQKPTNHKSDVWIAGPVIGGCLLVVLLPVALTERRRRKNAATPRPMPPPPDYELVDSGPRLPEYTAEDPTPMAAAPEELYQVPK